MKTNRYNPKARLIGVCLAVADGLTSFREIQDYCGFPSPDSAKRYIHQACQRKLLAMQPKRARTIRRGERLAVIVRNNKRVGIGEIWQPVEPPADTPVIFGNEVKDE